MKNHLTLLLAVFCGVSLFAQNTGNYQPFPDSTARWKEYNTSWCSYWSYRYELQGDTVLPGIGAGKKLYYRRLYLGSNPCPTASFEIFNDPPQLFGVITQDIDSKKVWFTRLELSASNFPTTMNNEIPVGETRLLYDFNLDVGDQLSWKTPPNEVGSIDSMQMLDGSWRRRFTFVDLDAGIIDTTQYWIEGMGGPRSLFDAYLPYLPIDAWAILSCFSENGDVLYSGSGSPDCDTIIVVDAAEPTPTLADMQVYPNPASGAFTVDIPEGALPALLRIFDTQGRLLQEREINGGRSEVALPSQNSGAVLFLQIRDTGGRQATRLLRVEP